MPTIRMFGRKAYVGEHLAGVEVGLFETLEGLEARIGDQCVGVLRNYRDMQQLNNWNWDRLPEMLYFEGENVVGSPLNSVAL